jgi:uncharacterized protein (TIGR02246 family)
LSASTDLVQRQLDAYNAQDIEAFMAFYTEDAELAGLNGAVNQAGHGAIRARHLDLFTEFPENRADVVNQIDLGSIVMVHERVARAPGGDNFDVAAIYTLRDGKIARVDFARGS